MSASNPSKRRVGTIFGWLAGGSLGLLLSLGLLYGLGDAYPARIGHFGLFVAGAFGGMAASDRLGDRALRWLGPLAGILLATALGLLIALSVGG